MSGNGNQVPLAPSQRGSGPYPRASTPHRPECYHPSGATGAAYIPSTAGGAQPTTQPSMRVQPTPQPSAPPAPPQDMSKTTMSGHNYPSPPTQTPPSRQQYGNFPYRAAQHGSRPSTHPRQQQPYIPGTAATATGPVMYHPTLVFQPTHMGPIPSYQQPRSTTPGYYQYVPPPYIGYSSPAGHTPSFYYPSNGQQMQTPNIPTNATGARNNPTTLVGPQGTQSTATAPAVSMPLPQPPGHIHQAMQGLRPAPTKRSRRVPIIDPVTKQEVLSDLYSDNGPYLIGESSERQTPQPEVTHSVAEEFTRMAAEAASQPSIFDVSAVKSNFVPKSMEMPLSSTTNPMQPQSNAICSINNNIVKSELLNVNENKTLGPDVAVEINETPVVSAISDSPVIVPKMPINVKQFQKNSEQNVQSLVLDTNKNVPANKQSKQHRSKPLVPQPEELEKNVVETISSDIAVVPATSTGPTPVAPVAAPQPQPQPQRIREPRERPKSEDKEKDKKKDKPAHQEPEKVPKPNGPAAPAVVTSVDNLTEIDNISTSQSSQPLNTDSKKLPVIKQTTPIAETEPPIISENKAEVAKKAPTPTATELLSASIEKVAREKPVAEPAQEKEVVSASTVFDAQAKLTQSLASCLCNPQTDSKMKDINLNNKDLDTANGNTVETTKSETKEDINKNEKSVKNKSNNKKANKMAESESNVKEASYENGKDETDKVSNTEQEKLLPQREETEPPNSEEKAENPPVPAFVPKYKYTDDQWSPLNTAGKKVYDVSLLKQIKEDPVCKNKPNAPKLDTWNLIRTAPLLDTPISFAALNRPANDSLFPTFFPKPSGVAPRNTSHREAKKDSRNMIPSGRGSVKLSGTPGGGSTHKPVIHVSLPMREEVKLNQTKDAWKPSRLKKENLSEEEAKTQELYKKFRGILNKLTPQKFDTLLDKVKNLEINNKERLEGVIDLVFEKAIDEPNFSEAYAAMCSKLSVLKVPGDNATNSDTYVNFRALIINKCQKQFTTETVDEQVLKLEKEVAACTDPVKKKELQAQLEEENRKVRMRSVGNVRFIGELYKLKMLTSKIMMYCINYLIDKLEEEKLECLCKLLTTIGEQVESEIKELDAVFKKMQEIVDRRSNKISSRVRFMLQDVIELRRKRWVQKSVIDVQPKMMDQIKNEAEQQQRHIELMNSSPMGGFRRDDGGRGKRGDGRRQGSNSFMDANNWKTPRTITVDTSKLKVGTQKNLSGIKLAPQNQGWNYGSGAKNPVQASSNSMISLTKNMYSVLETVQADPTSLRSNKDITPNTYSKGASIERSTFNSRGDFSSGSGGGASAGGSRSGSTRGVAGSNSSSRSTPPASAASTDAPITTAPIVPQEPLPETLKKSVKSTIDLFLINDKESDLIIEVKHLFKPQYHAAVVTEMLNVALEKSPKEIGLIAKALLHLVLTNTIAAENYLAGLVEIMEFAPDLYIDIPMLYDYLGKFIAPHIENKHITLAQIFKGSESIISSNHGHQLLKAIVKDLKQSMGPSFVKSKWQESGLQFSQWMNPDQLPKWLEENKFQFLEGGPTAVEETNKILSPPQTQSRLLQFMNADESCECIRGWVLDNLGKASNEDWFMRALIQAICEHALFGAESRDVPHFNQDQMNKYYGLINEFGESRQAREASCLFGIQQLIHKLEHPQGLTLEIFQYLHEQYIISVEGFIAWEESKEEPEGKAVMLKALTSFFTNIKEAYNEDSCSED